MSKNRIILEFDVEDEDNFEYQTLMRDLEDFAADNELLYCREVSVKYQDSYCIKDEQAKICKSIPKKPLPEERYYGNGKCPTCGAVFLDKLTDYCGNCGQKLMWDKTE